MSPDLSEAEAVPASVTTQNPQSLWFFTTPTSSWGARAKRGRLEGGPRVRNCSHGSRRRAARASSPWGPGVL